MAWNDGPECEADGCTNRPGPWLGGAFYFTEVCGKKVCPQCLVAYRERRLQAARRFRDELEGAKP